MKVNHFLITRFNVKFLDKADVNNIDWLKQRYELFEKYSLPSILNQTNKDFTWIVLFDSNLPNIFKAYNSKLEKSNNVFKPLYIEGYSHDLINKEIIALLKYPNELILTTRFDSDDVISANFLQSLKENIKRTNCTKGFYNQLNGYCYDDINQKLFRLSRYLSNPFISKLDSRSSFNNILSFKHDKIRHDNKIFNYRSRAQYLIIIHGGNYKNQPMGIPLTKMDNEIFPHINLKIEPYSKRQFYIKKITAHIFFIRKLLKELKLKLT